MPLVDIIDQPGWLQPGDTGIFFTMADGSNVVGVLVSIEAIDDAEPHSPLDRLRTFDANRSRFAHIASQKYDAGLREPDGSIVVKTLDLELR